MFDTGHETTLSSPSPAIFLQIDPESKFSMKLTEKRVTPYFLGGLDFKRFLY